MGLVIDTSALVCLEKARLEGSALPFASETLALPSIVWAEALIGKNDESHFRKIPGLKVECLA